jgi:glycerophosphoryl diester phosphodiesterase
MPPAQSVAARATTTKPLVIAHRGASGSRPEHTLAAYELAARQGAEVLEPDLVATRDGVLVVRHDCELSATTDVAGRPELADRRTTRVVDGVELHGWFAQDLTLEEVRTLRARERTPDRRPGSAAFDGLYEIPTFAELLALRARLSRELGRQLAVCPELKHVSHHVAAGLGILAPFLRDLRDAGLAHDSGLVVVQCSEDGPLRELAARTALPVVQLVCEAQTARLTGPGLDDVARYASAIGPHKALVDRALVEAAHRAGVGVLPYTFCADAVADMVAEVRAFLDLGVDGFFTDDPDLGRVAVDAR